MLTQELTRQQYYFQNKTIKREIEELFAAAVRRQFAHSVGHDYARSAIILSGPAVEEHLDTHLPSIHGIHSRLVICEIDPPVYKFIHKELSYLIEQRESPLKRAQLIPGKCQVELRQTNILDAVFHAPTDWGYIDLDFCKTFSTLNFLYNFNKWFPRFFQGPLLKTGFGLTLTFSERRDSNLTGREFLRKLPDVAAQHHWRLKEQIFRAYQGRMITSFYFFVRS